MSSLSPNLQVRSAYELDFCNVYIYNYFLLTVVNDGVQLDKTKSKAISDIAYNCFGDTIPFAYISLRTNSYSIDPTVYFTVRNIPNLKAFAIVSNKEIDFYNYKIENFFYKRNNMKIFFDKKSALAWVDKIMEIS